MIVEAPDPDRASEGLLRPLRADDATLEVLVRGSRGEGVDAARGGLLLFVDADVLAPRGLVSAHARAHERRSGGLVLGYTPIRILHERSPSDFAVRLRAQAYEARRELYERDPGSVLRELWGGNLSLRREDALAIGLTGSASPSDRELGARCLEAGLEAAFDRSLAALRLYSPSLDEFASEARAEGGGGVGTAGALRSAVLKAMVVVAGSAHVWSVQDLATRLLWEHERRRGEHGPPL